MGDNEVIAKLADSETVIIDLRGRTVVPGFNDAHDHLGWSNPPGIGFSTPAGDLIGPAKGSVLSPVRIRYSYLMISPFPKH